MNRISFIARGIAISALLAASATPALAGKADRAHAAIAQAQGKIDATHITGTSGEAPGLHAQAMAALRAARESLSSGHKEDAIAEANHASELADLALGKVEADRRAEQEASRADSAAIADSAQRDAAAANARADAAQQAAASAAADAAAARNAPPVMLAPAPAATVTTETVRQPAATTTRAHTAARATTRRTTAAPASVERTTTTVTTNPGM